MEIDKRANQDQSAQNIPKPEIRSTEFIGDSAAGKFSAQALGKPMKIDEYVIQPVDVKLISIQNNHCILRMTLYEGRNRQIRKMCQTQSLNILSLRRIAIGDLELGNLAPGQWRYLTHAQVQYLKNNASPKNKK